MATTRHSGPAQHASGGVTAQRRLRIVDEDGLRRFVAVRLTVSSPDRLLGEVENLVEWVRVAKRDAAEARAEGRWDAVHEIEVVSGERAHRMNTAEFAQFVDDLRTHR